LTGGLNTHATHHVWPHLPRSLHGWGSRRLRELEPAHYRSCDTIGACLAFFWNRKSPPPKRGLPTPKEYYERA
jgi:fatty acid desaturase